MNNLKIVNKWSYIRSIAFLYCSDKELCQFPVSNLELRHRPIFLKFISEYLNTAPSRVQAGFSNRFHTHK